MTSTYSIPERLISKISEVAKKEGFAKPEDFLTRLIEQKLLDLEVREKVLAITEKIHAAYEAKGISEEETLVDFEAFRNRLYQEKIKGKPA